MPDDLLTPILTDDLRSINYFNGRVLTAEDLQVEQHGHRRRHELLGQAAGEGVVRGLEVREASGTPSAVTVAPGLAFNRKGQALTLDKPVTVRIVPENTPMEVGDALFVPCPEATGATAVPVGTGAYVLVAAPASGVQALAPRVGLAGDGVARTCESRFVVEGLQFRLVELNLNDDALVPEGIRTLLRALASLPFPSAAARARLRNLVAHWCLGTTEIAPFAANLFDPAGETVESVAYGPLDVLRTRDEAASSRLTDCDVPLGLVFWQQGALGFVDRWAVRRRLMTPSAHPVWAPHVGMRRLAEAEAAFLQFQEHLEALLTAGVSLASSAAKDLLVFLPPGGYVPLGATSTSGFFSGLPTFHEALDEGVFRSLIFASWLEEPIDLRSEGPPSLLIYHHAHFVLFRRNGVFVEFDAAADTPEPAPSPPVTGRIEITVTGDMSAFDNLRGEAAKGTVKLEVKNLATGQSYTTKPVTKGRDVHGLADYFESFRPSPYATGSQVKFGTGTIPAGRYRVALSTASRLTQSKEVQVEGGTETVTFTLTTKPKTPGKRPSKPPRRVEKPGGDRLTYDKGILIDEQIRWSDPPDWMERVEAVVDPPPDVQAWGEDWAAWIQAEYPEAPVDPADFQLLVDPTYAPDATASEPYAYAVWGKGGAFAPIVLTPPDRSLGRSVGVGETGLAGVDRSIADRLGDEGFDAIDVLAAGWTGLVADTLGVGEVAAESVIAAARAQVDALQGSLRIFSGVDATLEAALEAAGIQDAVDLANAEPGALAAALANAGLSTTHALLLVDEARHVLPRGVWSLAHADLGLTDLQLGALEKNGMRTIGGFLGEAGTAAGRGRLLNVLNVGDDTLNGIEGALDARLSAAKVSIFARSRTNAPVTRLVGVSETIASRLEAQGIRTIETLADADPAAIAEVFGGDASRATTAITAARGKLPVTSVEGVDVGTARLLARRGIDSVEHLARAGTTEVAAALGGDAAAAAIGAARTRLGRS